MVRANSDLSICTHCVTQSVCKLSFFKFYSLFKFSKESLENSFTPYEREGDPTKIADSTIPIDLTELEKKIISNIKTITIIEFKTTDTSDQPEIDVDFDLTNLIENLQSDKLINSSRIQKRAINPKYKSAAISFFGSILASSPNGFQRTQLHGGRKPFGMSRG